VREPLPGSESVLCLLCLEAVAGSALATHVASVHGAHAPHDAPGSKAAEEAERSPELLQAAALLAVGHDDDALLALETAVERDPDLEEGWFQKGMLHIARREFPEALLCLERALVLDARDPRAWVAKFLAFERVGGRSSEAARCLIKAADLDPLFTQRWIAERFSEDELKEIRKRYGGGPAMT
jgi:Flp pilus assembly protein TadD